MPTVTSTSKSLEAQLLSVFDQHIIVCPEAKRLMADTVARMITSYGKDVPRILLPDERETLCCAIVDVRKQWLETDKEWLPDVINHGYEGWATTNDAALLTEVFYTHPVLPDSTKGIRIKLMKIFLRADVQSLLGAPNADQLENLTEAAHCIEVGIAWPDESESDRTSDEIKAMDEEYYALEETFLQHVENLPSEENNHASDAPAA